MNHGDTLVQAYKLTALRPYISAIHSGNMINTCSMYMHIRNMTITDPQTLTLPYIRGLAEAIRRILDPLGVKVVFRPLRTLRQMLVRPKDPVPVDERKGVVYSIPCVECSSVYIGQTGRSLKQRVSEHRRALKNGDIQASALAEHVLKTGHAVDLSQSEVLDHHQHTTTRCMLESWYIQHNQAALNRERGTLPEVYTALLD